MEGQAFILLKDDAERKVPTGQAKTVERSGSGDYFLPPLLFPLLLPLLPPVELVLLVELVVEPPLVELALVVPPVLDALLVELVPPVEPVVVLPVLVGVPLDVELVVDDVVDPLEPLPLLFPFELPLDVELVVDDEVPVDVPGPDELLVLELPPEVQAVADALLIIWA